MSEVTKEEWDDWKNHPVTKEFFNALREQREAVAEQLTGGRFLGTGQTQDLAVMEVKVYDDILSLEVDDSE